MRVILTLALLYVANLQAQQITLTPLPDAVKENKISDIWQVQDGSYVAIGENANSYFKLDKQLNVIAISQLNKKATIKIMTTLEFGKNFYEFGTNYTPKEGLLKFAVSDFNDVNQVKYYHSETFSLKENGDYAQYYYCAISPDKQKMALVWLDPSSKTKFTVYEFDQNFNKTNEYTFKVDVPLENKKHMGYFTAKMDSRNNIIVTINADEEKKVWLVKLSLNDKRKEIKLLECAEDHEDISNITIDGEHSTIYYITHIKNPTKNNDAFRLNGAKSSISFSREIATLYSIDIETFQTKSTPIKINREEEPLIRAVDANRPDDKKLPEAFFIKDTEINLFSNGNCAVTITLGCKPNGSSQYVLDLYSNTLLRIYTPVLQNIASKTLNVERNYYDQTERIMLGNELYYFVPFRIPHNANYDILKKGCYKISDTGDVKAYYPNLKDDVFTFPYRSTQSITTSKILVSCSGVLHWLECK